MSNVQGINAPDWGISEDSSGNLIVIFKANPQGKIITIPPTPAAGLGLEDVQAAAELTGKTAAVSSICSVTSPNDGQTHTYRVQGHVNITVHSSESINFQVSYTDDNGSARTAENLPLSQSGLFAAAANSAANWKTPAMDITVNPNTTITLLTGGTFTGATYNTSGVITRLT